MGERGNHFIPASRTFPSRGSPYPIRSPKAFPLRRRCLSSQTGADEVFSMLSKRFLFPSHQSLQRLSASAAPIMGFDSVCTVSCTRKEACADIIRSSSGRQKETTPDGCCLFLEKVECFDRISRRGVQPGPRGVHFPKGVQRGITDTLLRP